MFPSSRRNSDLPWVARTLMPREVGAFALMAVALGALEGGLVGVIVKTGFAGVAAQAQVNLAVALVAGAPALANISSLAISALTRGRDKPRTVAAMMAAAALCLLGIAAAPVTAAGLWLLTVAMIAGRLAWAGVVTLRSAIWRSNFPRQVRARITGRVNVTYSLIIAVTAGCIGLAQNYWPEAYRVLYPVAAMSGLYAATRYRFTRHRYAGRLLRDETRAREEAGVGGLRGVWAVLANDADYRRYMITMFVFGSGNLMVIALLVVILTEQFGFSQFTQVLVTTTLPLSMVALATPLWARRFDRVHVLDYRARHSWVFVAAIALFAGASIGGFTPLFWLGALVLGAGFAGGQIGWNLGHNDFASDGQSTLYMGIHVTLTGVRGLIAPLAGVGVYQFLESRQPGLGRWVLVLPLALSVSGAVTFVVLNRLRLRAA